MAAVFASYANGSQGGGGLRPRSILKYVQLRINIARINIGQRESSCWEGTKKVENVT